MISVIREVIASIARTLGDHFYNLLPDDDELR